MRDSFIFYRSFQDAIDGCPIEDQLAIYKAIANYALNRTDPDLTGVAKVCWVLIKPQLEANWRRFENGCRGGDYGKRGGAPRGNSNATKQNNPKTTPNQPQNNPKAVEKTTPNVFNVNDNVNDNVLNDNENVETKVSQRRETKRFTKPSLQDINIFIQELSLSVDAEAFYNYYEANGWMVGKNHMKDWKAAVRNWSKKEWNTPSRSQKMDKAKEVNYNNNDHPGNLSGIESPSRDYSERF